MCKSSKICLLILVCSAFSACSTKKKRSEVGWLGKVYHNTTARYNGYYNANVLLDESILTLESQHTDNYNQMLDLYPVIEIDNPKAVAEDLDKAIEKVTTVALLHPASHWVDDCYVLMGHAQFLKQDYETAEETLKYFSDEFDPGFSLSRRTRQSKTDEPSASEMRREELKAARQQREVEQKINDEFRERKKDISDLERDAKENKRKDDRSFRNDINELKKKHKNEDQDLKEAERDLVNDQKKEIQDLKEKHRNAGKKRRQEAIEKQKKEREELKKEREKAARENTRSQRKKKTDEEEDENKKAQTQEVDQEAIIQKQEEAELKSLEQKHAEETRKMTEKRNETEQRWTRELEQLESRYKQNQDQWDLRLRELAEEEENLSQQKKKEEEIAREIAEQQAAEAEEKEKEKENAGKNSSPPINKGQGGGLFKHKPVYDKGLLLLAKTYVERENWSSAEYLLRRLRNTSDISKEVAREIPVVHAHALIKQQNYDEALDQLDQAIQLADKKENRARYSYVKAQIHQMQNRIGMAYEAFQQAAGSSKSYEMKFNAELSMARNSWSSGQNSIEAAFRDLEKMMGDGKNKEYLDQIYFTRAEIKLATGDENGAFEDFKNALAASSGNQTQKAESYFRLAEIYYQLEDYRNASLYYDSTGLTMPTSDERLLEVRRQSNNLKEIARNLEILETQDSLLRMGQMTEEELNQWASEELDRRKEQEEQAELAQDSPSDSRDIRSPFSGSASGSSFFAYNSLALQKGLIDFSRKWGDRKLEDDWRRANKQSSLIEENLENVTASSEEEIPEDSEISEILEGIPRSDMEKEAVINRLRKALLELGLLYRARIQNHQRSIEALTSLLYDYSGTDLDLDAYYYMYLDYVDLGDEAKAAQYKTMILEKYPDSEYAQILGDPEYFARLEAEKNKLDNYYNDTYQVFLDGYYEEAEKRIVNAGNLFSDNKYAVKFDFLLAMIEGSKNGKPAYIKSLKDFVLKYPNTAEETRAKEILRFLQGDEEAFDSRIYAEALEEFILEDDKLHYIILVVYDANEKAINDAKIKLTRYHNQYHKPEKLKISNIYLNPETKSQIILIRKFNNRSNALSYIDTSIKNQNDFLHPDELSFELFAVTQRNYREIMKQRTVKNYRVFFEQHYTR